MLYFHCGPSRQEKTLIKLDQNGEKINTKKKIIITIIVIKKIKEKTHNSGINNIR